MDDQDEFFADGSTVYGAGSSGDRVEIASCESESWAQTIAAALNNDPDAYVV